MNEAAVDAAEQEHIVGRYALRMVVRPGRKDRPPLVLANGIGVPLEVLDPFVAALDPDLEVIRFDAPGVGGTPTPSMPLPYQVIARALAAALDELHYGTVDMLGISWGGGLAQQFAFQNPRRCRRLVLAATATGSVMVPATPSVLRHMLTPRRHRDPVYARSVAGDIYGGSLRSPDAPSPLGAAAQGGSSRGYLFQLLGTTGWTSLPWLPMIRQRTLVLAGSDDPIVPLVNARIMTRLLPNAELEVYPDGHLGLITRATELAASVSMFLSA